MSLSVNVLTVFPTLVESALSEGMVRIARDRGALKLNTLNVREFSTDVHRSTDDSPYGGGVGMVMLAEPITKAWRSIPEGSRGKAFVMSAKGVPFSQTMAEQWSGLDAVTLVCGRYQGIDERVIDILKAEEVSLGDFVLPGGELAAAAMIESTARLLPGVLGDAESGVEDSHRDALLGFPDYTRPELFEGHAVPEVLLSGHHANIVAWRREQRLKLTWKRRPDLLEKAALNDEDRDFLDRLYRESQQAKEES